MVKALIKKQYYETFRTYFVNNKTNKARSKGGVIGFFVMFAGVMLFLGSVFFGLSFLMGDLLNLPGFAWLYYTIMGMLAIALGTFGSVFNTYSALYMSKDNELLLAMPIPPSKILLSRMALVYGLSLLYSGVVWVPAVIVSWIVAVPPVTAIVFDLLLILLLALFVTVLTCALGWVVALVAVRMKNKSFFVVLLSLAFFGIYYYFCFNVDGLLMSIVENSESIGGGIKVWANLLYQLGCAANGAVPAMAIFSGVTLALFALCLWLLSRSFVHITTMTPAAGKAVKATTGKRNSLKTALYRRELKHFTSSATYMLNCGLGIFILLIGAVAAVVKGDVLEEMLAEIQMELPFIPAVIPLAVPVLVCLIVAINAISTPSISLEGKTLWIIRSLPVSGRDVLTAKRDLHVSLNAVPAVLATLVVGFRFHVETAAVLLGGVYVFLFVWFGALTGLLVGLLRPNFQWTSEASPIKQSLNPIFCWILGWAVLAASCAGCYFLRDVLDTTVCLGIASVLLALVNVGLNRWMNTAGAARFERL